MSETHDRARMQVKAEADAMEALRRDLAQARADNARLLDEARHAKGQMELRWQAAEKECAALRAKCEERNGKGD